MPKIIQLLLFTTLSVHTTAASARDTTLQPLYERIAADARAGRPLVLEFFIALCDNDSQGIVPVKNRRICDGDDAARNNYWGVDGGLDRVLRRTTFRKRKADGSANTDVSNGVLFTEVFSNTQSTGGRLRSLGIKKVGVEIRAHVYRGRAIGEAMRAYLTAVAQARGNAHVLGYIGHNYLLDVAVQKPVRGREPKIVGAFALSCLGTTYIRPRIDHPHSRTLLLNRSLTYPGAWSALGLVQALVKGEDAKGVHFLATRRFAEGRLKPHGTMLRAFSYGNAP